MSDLINIALWKSRWRLLGDINSLSLLGQNQLCSSSLGSWDFIKLNILFQQHCIDIMLIEILHFLFKYLLLNRVSMLEVTRSQISVWTLNFEIVRYRVKGCWYFTFSHTVFQHRFLHQCSFPATDFPVAIPLSQPDTKPALLANTSLSPLSPPLPTFHPLCPCFCPLSSLSTYLSLFSLLTLSLSLSLSIFFL